MGTLESKQQALLKTIDVLEKIIDLKSNTTPNVIVRQLQIEFLKSLIHAWEEEKDVVGIAAMIRGCLEYSNKDFIFYYRLAECVNYTKNLMAPVPKPLFNLN